MRVSNLSCSVPTFPLEEKETGWRGLYPAQGHPGWGRPTVGGHFPLWGAVKVWGVSPWSECWREEGASRQHPLEADCTAGLRKALMCSMDGAKMEAKT